MAVAMLLVLNPLHWHAWHSWWLPALAVLLDLLLGDPPFPPHPVRGIGWVLDKISKPLIKLKSPKIKFFWGMQAVLICPFMVVTISAFLMALPGAAGIFFGVYLSYAGLALGSLLREGARVAGVIENGTLAEGRLAVSGLVSRDVQSMDQAGLYRSLAESLSENFCDAFIGPFHWLVLTGPAGLWAYKTISTMDSMWGYKYAPWQHIGKGAATMEDFLSYVPARLSALFLFAGARLLRLDFSWANFKEAIRQAKLMESPNAGWSMATAAWAHQACMGGPVSYNGGIKQKPVLGPCPEETAAASQAALDEVGVWTPAKIRKLLAHLKISGFLGALVLISLIVPLGFLLSGIR